MRCVESCRQSCDDKRSDQPWAVREQQERTSRSPKESERDDVTPSVSVGPSSNHGAKKNTWQAVSCKSETDPCVVKVIAAYEEKGQLGKDSTMKRSVTKDKCHGSATTWSLQDDEVFANHLLKGTAPPVRFNG